MNKKMVAYFSHLMLREREVNRVAGSIDVTVRNHCVSCNGGIKVERLVGFSGLSGTSRSSGLDSGGWSINWWTVR